MKAMKWAYPICPRITTIGKTGCDIIIDNPTVDQQHAVIEYDPSNGLLTLRDLSSRKGTFVNDQRVDGIVRLLVGDKLSDQKSFTGTQPENLGNQEKRPGNLIKISYNNEATIPPWVKVCGDSDSSQINIPRIVPSDPCSTNPAPNLTTNDSTGNDFSSDQKDKYIKQLKEQINRLAPLEAITTQKDILIKHLQNQISQINQINRLFHHSGNCTPILTPRNTSLIENHTQTDTVQYVNLSSNQIPHHIQQNGQQNVPVRIRPGSTPSQMKLSTNDTMLTNQDHKINNDHLTDEQLLEKTRRERQILSGLVTQLQKDLSNKDVQMNRLNKELSQMKNQLTEKDTTIDALHLKYNKSQDKKQYNLEKEQFEKELDSIRQKYKTSELHNHSLQDELDKIKLDNHKLLQDVESKSSIETKLRNELEEIQMKIIELERSVRIHQLDKHQAISEYERLRSHQKVTSKDDLDSNHNEQLLDRIQYLVDDYKHIKHKLQMNNTIEDQIKQENKKIEKELDGFIHVYIEAQQNMKDTPRFRSSLRLKQNIELLAAYVPASEILKRLQRILLDDLQDQVNTQQRLEDCVQEAVGTIQSQNTETSFSFTSFFCFTLHQIDIIHIFNRPDDLISTIRHLAELTSTMIQQKMDLLKQIKLNEIEHHEEIIKTKSLIQNEWKMIMILAEKQITHESELNEAKEANELLSRLKQEIQLKDNQLEEMKSQLDQQNQSNAKLYEEIERQCESRWKTELDSYREQVRQHSRTICVMEERLVKLTKQLKDNLQNENKQLQTRLTEAHSRLQSLRTKTSARHNDDTNKHSSAYSSIDDNTSPKLVDNLKLEISQLQNIIKDQTSTIEVLRSDLEGTQAQLSDLKGELTESQKEEIENALNYELTNSKHEYECKIKHLQDTLNYEREESSQCHHDQMNTSSKLTQELINLGNQCKGERHYEIIDKQKEALSQLRQRLRDQYMYILPKGNTENDELILQITKLKRENAELRSKTLLAEVVPSIKALTNNSTLVLDHIKNDGDDDDPMTDQILSKMDHIGLRNAMDALYTSEECYLNLVRSISTRLDLDRLPGQRSLIQVPKMERETVRKERQTTIELLSHRIEILKDQVQHKENLLNEYEPEALADAKSEQVDQFINQLHSKETEIQLLRQSLDRTREALLNEQRSIAAFKKSREQRQRKVTQEKLKRKDYEIDTLKNQLEERNKRLQLLSDQMMKMRMQMASGNE
ncbi:hypothetical protein Smp_131620 [Schistosoma mansoni]|uniref:hypothetical protein n=1 Tax=Schistosoma mansoni TaxID=6183 RepID=UPI00022DC55F|nr:hypothetical protein Smp_131620 [Schistosoma mansoni]|eukprot:XP_018650644.1 hypothetical protein Smp_131620 [Schistosoma mansoni]